MKFWSIEDAVVFSSRESVYEYPNKENPRHELSLWDQLVSPTKLPLDHAREVANQTDIETELLLSETEHGFMEMLYSRIKGTKGLFEVRCW